MTPQALQALIGQGEDTRHQFKRDFSHIDSMAAELVAFANGLGGLLLRGLGTGIPRAMAAWQQVQLVDDQRAHQFKAIVSRVADHTTVSGGVDQLLTLLAAQPGLNAAALAAQLSTPKRTVERWLRQLRQTGAVEFQGPPKTGGYYLVAALQQNKR